MGRRRPRSRRRPSLDRLVRPETELRVTVERPSAGLRLDRLLAERMTWRSRSAIQKLIVGGGVTVEGLPRRCSYRVREGETVRVPLPKPSSDNLEAMKRIPLHILHEDAAMIVLNKQPGIVVHPVGGKLFNTLLNALHLRYRRFDDPERDVVPKLAHRLDKDTSGVLVAAKTDDALRRLRAEFDRKSVQKEYLAIVEGDYPAELREIDLPIGTDAEGEIKMKRAARPRGEHLEGAQEAQTWVEVAERLGGFTLLRLWPRTGKTHQLRVHLAAVGHPILCDALYGKRRSLAMKDVVPDSDSDEVILDRQALHAHRLRLRHPVTLEWVEFTAPLPEDMQRALDALRRR